jgi:iron-sulfur cluster repair protein YtfE (RIC family)
MNARGAGRMLMLGSAAALGVVAGVALARSKRFAFRARARLHGDWFGHLRSEHKIVRKLLKAMTHADFEQPARRAALLEKVSELLTRHAVEEENAVYPALDSMGEPGEASSLVDDHAEMKTALRELQAMSPEDPLWRDKAKALKKAFDEHVREEEDYLFPVLRENLGDSENAKLTKLVQREGVRLT